MFPFRKNLDGLIYEALSLNNVVPYYSHNSNMLGESTPADAGTSSSFESGMKIVTIDEIAVLDENRRKRRPAKGRVVLKRGRSGRGTTYTDELRSLIHTQMSAWEAFLRQKGRVTRPLKRLQ